MPAVAHLCKLTKASHLVYGSRFPAEAEQAQKLLADQGYDIEIVPEKRFPLWGQDGVERANIVPFPAVLRPKDEMNRVAVILHSSGSVCVPLIARFFVQFCNHNTLDRIS